MKTAVDLHQHAFAWGILLPSHPVPGRPTFPRAGNARPGQDVVHRSPAGVNPLPVTQQLGEVGLIGSGIGDGVAGPTAAGSRGPVRRRPPCDRPPAFTRPGCVFSPLSPLGW